MPLFRKEPVNITNTLNLTNPSNGTNTSEFHIETTGYAIILFIIIIFLFYILHSLQKNVKNKKG